MRNIVRTAVWTALAAVSLATAALAHAQASPAAAMHATARLPSTRLAVTGAVKIPLDLDLAALQVLPAGTAMLGAASYSGVDLWTLLDTVAGLKLAGDRMGASLSMYVVATGTDGYQAVLSLGELDPAFGARKVLVATSMNGTPLGANGMARLIVTGDVKQGRSVSNLASIEVFALPAKP